MKQIRFYLAFLIACFFFQSCDGSILDDVSYSSVIDFNPDDVYSDLINNLNQVNPKSPFKPLVLCQFSDLHGDSKNARRILEFCDHYSNSINDIINCGDIINEYNSSFSWWSKIKNSQYVLNTIGNHDTYEKISDDNTSWTAHVGLDAYSKFIKPFVMNWNVVQPANENEKSYCYYYKDYLDSNIRLINVNSMQFNQQHCDWLNMVLDDAIKKGLSVIGMTHYAPSVFYSINCSFTSARAIAAGKISGWVFNSSDGSPKALVKSFIDRGGEFICWLTGHYHYDFIGKDTVNGNQMIICVEPATSNKAQIASSRTQRVNGTKSQDSFNIIGFDTDSHTIKIVRVGNEYDYDGRNKKTIVINYKDVEIVSDY